MPLRSRSSAASIAAVATAALGFGACEQPQKGALSVGWCQPAAADAATVVMLDDMEDGDAQACQTWAGRWSVEATGVSVPASGTPVKPQEVNVPLPSSHTAPSERALRLTGSLAAGQYAQLTLPLSSVDLSAYKEIDFWSRSDSNTGLNLSVGVVTASGAFSTGATIQGTWGDSGGPNNVALAALNGGVITDEALAASSGITFRYEALADGEFGFWIDDVQLKRK
ncbi:MAG TPA: hypothetical protein VIU64_06510 [Polyangia bacterium]